MGHYAYVEDSRHIWLTVLFLVSLAVFIAQVVGAVVAVTLVTVGLLVGLLGLVGLVLALFDRKPAGFSGVYCIALGIGLFSTAVVISDFYGYTTKSEDWLFRTPSEVPPEWESYAEILSWAGVILGALGYLLCWRESGNAKPQSARRAQKAESDQRRRAARLQRRDAHRTAVENKQHRLEQQSLELRQTTPGRSAAPFPPSATGKTGNPAQ